LLRKQEIILGDYFLPYLAESCQSWDCRSNAIPIPPSKLCVSWTNVHRCFLFVREALWHRESTNGCYCIIVEVAPEKKRPWAILMHGHGLRLWSISIGAVASASSLISWLCI